MRQMTLETKSFRCDRDYAISTGMSCDCHVMYCSQEMDIDEILQRAETEESEPQVGGVANDLLSQFKVG